MALNTTIKPNTINSTPLKWEITRDQALYCDQKYNISFRLVVLHAIKHYLNNNPFDPKSTKTLLTELKNATEPKTTGYYEPHFMELYPFNKNGEQGLVLIDRSYGCFALLLYPKDKNPEHGFRIVAFINALEDLLLNHESYDQLLNSGQAWDTKLVDQLRATFKFSKNEDSAEF